MIGSLYPCVLNTIIWPIDFKSMKGESKLSPQSPPSPSPPPNCSHMYNLSVILFFHNVWTSHLGLFLFVLSYLISFRLHLINYFEKFNKH
jgi:hypothetical protein